MAHTQAELPQGAPALAHPPVGTLPNNKRVLPRLHHQPPPQQCPLLHLLHFFFLKMHLFAFLLMSPLFAFSYLSFCVFSVYPHGFFSSVSCPNSYCPFKHLSEQRSHVLGHCGLFPPIVDPAGNGPEHPESSAHKRLPIQLLS